jgi:radical SAM superfamily enzyme YgiQ (UPF0313 family)
MSLVGSQPRSRAPRPRRILCASPRYARSFGTFDHAFPLLGVRAFMPPQGLLVIAAALPAGWEVRFVDENVREIRDADLDWADALLLSGMHVQRQQIDRIVARAHARGVLTVLGGPSVSASPGLYPDVDLLHVGELGDAFDRLVERLDRDVSRPAEQEVYRTVDRRPLEQYPVPAYRHLRLQDYLLASVQFSSGCPFQCEFCDIPALYGRRPRLKTPVQVTRELDALLERGNPGTVYFVDDNFIGNPRAALALLQHLVAWQQERGYPLSFACEATMNLAQREDLLELMQQARFTTAFLGVESPDADALQLMRKRQNLKSPLLQAVEALNRYGLEVVAGLILGLDTDDEQSGERVVAFIEGSQIPMLTINLLHALPLTPLWDRLERSGRLCGDPGGRESNVEFLRPYDDVVSSWRDTVTRAFAPEAVYGRFRSQLTRTYPHRRAAPSQLTPANLRRGLAILGRICWHVGVRSDYRREFWRMALPLFRQGRIEKVIHIAAVSHHLIRFAREVADGTAEKSFYSSRTRAAAR